MLHRHSPHFVLLLSGFVTLAICQNFPFEDPKLPWDQRVNDLVSRLTLDEMVSQKLNAVTDSPPSVPRLNVPPYRFDSECLHGYVNRNATAFPQSVNLASAFRCVRSN